MTNKEKYKQAFSVLHTSDISEGEVKYMAKLKKQQKMKLAAAAIAACGIVGGRCVQERLTQQMSAESSELSSFGCTVTRQVPLSI